MYECSYSREPVDYKLLALRTVKKIWVFIVGAIVGAILVAGIHSVKKLIISGGRTYQAETVFWLEYASGLDELTDISFNYYTWGEIAKSDFIIDYMMERFGGEMSREEMISAIELTCESDVRYLYSRCTAHSPQMALEMEHAMEEALAIFISEHREFERIDIVKAAVDTKEVTNYRLSTALILGASLGLVASIIIWLCLAITDTDIYIPATVEKRYHIPTLGAPSMEEFDNNVRHYTSDVQEILVITPNQNDNVMISAKDVCVEQMSYNQALTDTETIKKNIPVFVQINSGANNGKQFERLIEELSRFSIGVTAVALCNADDKLIKRYYRG